MKPNVITAATDGSGPGRAEDRFVQFNFIVDLGDGRTAGFQEMSGIDAGFEEGEPMALVNGSPCAAALAADVALVSRQQLHLAEQVFALSVEAFRAPLEAYDQALDALWEDENEVAALRG